MIGTLNAYWGERGAVIMQPYHTELGAGTSNPATFLRVLDPTHPEWRAAYVEPVIRPTDGRYGENPYRFQHYFQYQVILKPAPEDVLDQYFGSLEALGIDLLKHDIRLVEDDWEQPTLGAWGLGWEVWCDAMEVTQFTYFQQLGGIDLEIIPAEMTYGLERLGLFLQDKKTVLDLEWAPGVTWGDVYQENERQWSQYNYEEAPVDVLQRRFDEHEAEAEQLLEQEPAAAGLRPGAEVVARVQPARRARRGVGDRAGRLHRARPQRSRAVLPSSTWGPMATLLIEIGCEELPAAACREAERQLPELARRALGVEPSKVLVTPRRLAVLVGGRPGADRGPVGEGPAGRDAGEGRGGLCEAPRRRGRGARGARRLPRRRGGREAARGGAARARSTSSSAGLAFSKTMRWDDSGLRFPRPVRWRLAMLNSTRIVGERSYGHRFSSGADRDRRRGRLRGGSARRRTSSPTARSASSRSSPRSTASETGPTRTASWPRSCTSSSRRSSSTAASTSGTSSCRAGSSRRRSSTTSARSRSEATGLRSSRTAATRTRFAQESRTSSEDGSRTRRSRSSGTSRSGSTRLAERLGAITFFHGAGSFADKTERLVKLVEALGGGEAALEAARLAKADQASELVREFPELEGHVGAEYARLAGYPEAVCAAIDEQYLPDAAEAPLPTTETGRVLSAADKIDTLNVSFGLGQRPTGSRDPYGLRRAAIGLGRLADRGQPLDPARADGRRGRRVRRGALRGPARRHRSSTCAPRVGLRCATSAASPGSREALAALPDERLGPIHTAYMRASRLAEKEQGAAAELEPALLVEDAEAKVAAALERVDPEIAAALDAGDFNAAVEAGAELGPLLDRFFEDVLVLADDRAVRANRLRLLLNVRDTLGRLGELSQIPG